MYIIGKFGDMYTFMTPSLQPMPYLQVSSHPLHLLSLCVPIIVIGTQHKIYTLRKFVSISYSIVNCRHCAVQWISRFYFSSMKHYYSMGAIKFKTSKI